MEGRGVCVGPCMAYRVGGDGGVGSPLTPPPLLLGLGLPRPGGRGSRNVKFRPFVPPPSDPLPGVTKPFGRSPGSLGWREKRGILAARVPFIS